MACDSCSIMVFFEEPFWVGIYERIEETGYSVSKLTFGAEPKDYEVYHILMTRWKELSFSPATPAKQTPQVKVNSKRMRKEAARQLSGSPVGTRAQEALKLQYTEGKEQRREKSRQEREAEQERKFRLRQEKKQQKHRGR